MVGSDFVRAVERACDWHDGQVRKGTGVPYVSHLLAVASLVLEAGGDEELAIAAMLHDVVEDRPDEASPETIREEFGERVADIVVECSDREHGIEGTPDNWRERKEAYIRALGTASPDALLVSCADKLHNARSLLRDLLQEGKGVWERFNEPDPAEQLSPRSSSERSRRSPLGLESTEARAPLPIHLHTAAGGSGDPWGDLTTSGHRARYSART